MPRKHDAICPRYELHDRRTVLRRVRDAGIHGGRTYDAIIAACALKARATALLTFNKAHFLPFEERELAIVVPSEGELA